MYQTVVYKGINLSDCTYKAADIIRVEEVLDDVVRQHVGKEGAVVSSEDLHLFLLVVDLWEYWEE